MLKNLLDLQSIPLSLRRSSSYPTSRQVREDILGGSKDGTIKIIANRLVLREGLDAPWLALYWFSENRNFAFERVARVLGLRRSLIHIVGVTGWPSRAA
jgi:hypothetical protein